MNASIHTMLSYFWDCRLAPPVGNLVVTFLFLYFPFLSVSTILPSSLIFDGGLTAPHFWTGICHWWISLHSSSNLMFVIIPLSLFYVLYELYLGTETGNEAGTPSGDLGDSLALRVTTISRLDCSTSIPLNKSLFSVTIKALIFYRDSHEMIVLHGTTFPISKDTVKGCVISRNVEL